MGVESVVVLWCPIDISGRIFVFLPIVLLHARGAYANEVRRDTAAISDLFDVLWTVSYLFQELWWGRVTGEQDIVQFEDDVVLVLVQPLTEINARPWPLLPDCLLLDAVKVVPTQYSAFAHYRIDAIHVTGIGLEQLAGLVFRGANRVGTALVHVMVLRMILHVLHGPKPAAAEGGRAHLGTHEYRLYQTHPLYLIVRVYDDVVTRVEADVQVVHGAVGIQLLALIINAWWN